MNCRVTVLVLLTTVAGARELNAATLGPDAFGYTAASAPFLFADITGTGTRILPASDDDTLTVDLGFHFDFYGAGYGQVCISANGLLAFGGCEPSPDHVDLATTSTFNDVPTIAALWDDWQFFTPGTDAVYYQISGTAGSRIFTSEWSLAKGNFPYSPGAATFEAILGESTSEILLQYLDTATQDFRQAGGNATVGIRDAGGETNGRNLVWSYNAPATANGTAVRFGVTPVPEPGSGWLLAGAILAGMKWAARGRAGSHTRTEV